MRVEKIVIFSGIFLWRPCCFEVGEKVKVREQWYLDQSTTEETPLGSPRYRAAQTRRDAVGTTLKDRRAGTWNPSTTKSNSGGEKTTKSESKSKYLYLLLKNGRKGVE